MPKLATSGFLGSGLPADPWHAAQCSPYNRSPVVTSCAAYTGRLAAIPNNKATTEHQRFCCIRSTIRERFLSDLPTDLLQPSRWSHLSVSILTRYSVLRQVNPSYTVDKCIKASFSESGLEQCIACLANCQWQSGSASDQFLRMTGKRQFHGTASLSGRQGLLELHRALILLAPVLPKSASYLPSDVPVSERGYCGRQWARPANYCHTAITSRRRVKTPQICRSEAAIG